MKICIVGAGAIGGMLAVKLARAGHEVSAVLRGANLATARAQGLTLIEADGQRLTAQLARVSESPAELGIQDVVLLSVKAHQVAALAPQLPALLGAGTRIVTLQNGVPWWYFQKLPGAFEGRAIASLDPDGVIARHLPVDALIGSVVYPAGELVQPGVIRHIEGNRFTLGELDGQETPSLRAIAMALREAGFKAPISSDIRSEIWLKLWGNLSFNPISALTHATLEQICRFPGTRALAAAMMAEAQAIAEKLGSRFKLTLEQRIAGTEAVGPHKTSMLQDVEAGRALELQALVGAVIELGAITGLPTPHIVAVHALAGLLAEQLQQHGSGLSFRTSPSIKT